MFFLRGNPPSKGLALGIGRNIKTIFLFLLFPLLLFGCDYLRMTFSWARLSLSSSQRQDPEVIKQGSPDKCGILMGKIIDDTQKRRPVIIIASSVPPADGIPADHTVLTGSGPYLLFVPEGRYAILAFEDLNNNRICEDAECIGQYNNPRIVSVAAGQVIGGLNVRISQNTPFPSPFSMNLKIPVQNASSLTSLECGGIVNLNHGLFSKKYGTTGLWEPSWFIKTLGINIYALAAFDASKIPILFIHGSGGTPKDWELFANEIDKEQYQPWFFYYPSGLCLQTLSDLLYEKISSLRDRYAFKQLYITAHSMGGLITRRFIDRYDRDHPSYNLTFFVSLATPWGGVDSAKLAPERSLFRYPPAWRDLDPRSEFLETLFQEKIPSTIWFYLFFGYKRNDMPFKENDDGVVSLKSLLDDRAQTEAIKCIGFNENHVSILFSKDVIQRYKELLDRHFTAP